MADVPFGPGEIAPGELAGALPRAPRALVRSSFQLWWREIDKPILAAVLGLLVIGVTLSFAAGPVVAMRVGLSNPMHFVERHLIFMIPALVTLFAASILAANTVRRLGVLIAAGAFGMIALTLLVGPEFNGAQRWLYVAGFSVQPAELFKPGFVLLGAWLLAETRRTPSINGGVYILAIYASAAFMLLMQPDYGQLLLITAIWAVMIFIAGLSWGWVAALAASGMGVLALGYRIAPHVKARIDSFLSGGADGRYQVNQSLEAISRGGLLGHDLNHMDGVKQHLPDAHTDFVFAVAAEEFGFLLGAAIIAAFGVIAWRSLRAAERSDSLFVRCAIGGFTAHLICQAFVNIGVSLAMLPAKGMTLPFISYGGSSLLATALSAGFLLALIRKTTPS